MKEIIFTVKGRIPSKKNSKQIIRGRGGRPMIISGSDYLKWARSAINTLGFQRIANKVSVPITQCTIQVEITFPDLRQRDLSNVIEGLMDCLVDVGILEDDNWRVVNRLDMISMGADKDNAGARITITTP